MGSLRYIEAYPRLVARETLGQWRQGRLYCAWQNERDITGATGRVDWLSTTDVSFDFHIAADRSHLEEQCGHVDLAVGYIPMKRTEGVGFICPSCHKLKQ